MLSIFKVNDRKQEGPIRYLKPVLLGISQHAVESDPEELAQFRKTVDEIAGSLSATSTPEDILIKIGIVVQAMEEYNRRANHSSTAYRKELRAILSLLTETIISLSQSSKTGVEQLQAIEKALEGAVDVSDARLLRNKLIGTLTLIRNESARVRLESQSLIKSLKAAVMRASIQTLPSVAALPPDLATGLAGGYAARRLIEQALAAGRAVSVAMFLVDQLPALNTRFGRAVGDETLLTISQYLSYEMAEFGALIRWNGPAFVLVVDDSQPNFERFERRVKELAGARFEREIKVEERSVKMNITFSWTVQSARPNEPVEEIARRLDEFVSTRIA